MTIIQHIAAYQGRFDQFDAVVVGSGPSGSMVARTLAEKGKHVLILELGAHAPPGAVLTTHQSVFGRAITEDNIADGNPWTACCVGGGMQFYSAITFRYRDADMHASRYLNSDMEMDWPIALQDLNEHYDYVEMLMGITEMGNYPVSARGTKIAAAMSLLDYQPKNMPLAILPPGKNGGCSYCAACDSRSCPIGAKASVFTRSVIDDTLLKGSITLLYGCVVKKIVLDKQGHAGSVECYIPFSSQHLSVPVEKIICCGNAIQSSALLMRSKSNYAPQGIGNDYDLVGRGLSFKISGYSIGSNPLWLQQPDLGTPHQGAPATVYTDAFYQAPDVPTGMGGLIYEAASPFPEKNIGHLRIHYLAGEEAWSHNRISLDDEEDVFGNPLIRFHYKNTENDQARFAFLADRADDILRQAGATSIEREVPQYKKGSSHLHGTARAGQNPERAVVDLVGKVHGYDNIYVMDASVMNFAGNWNPTHTIMANARRMAIALD
ncbi:sugar-alcohol dehydrogenase [Pectobacterium betavasculorum]|uniref:Sugar-alcohol dehydrogenase n=1 Tax=Pectobacterium betavasculorum TaxID=55207 RepID=A0A093RX21_9GAMM|nr:GMC family oxidoreductase [Pectobacterium betavasculorum]KFX07375.1 sugar-alcohol dehydrogenase [Pectobacterium betavasculorum]